MESICPDDANGGMKDDFRGIFRGIYASRRNTSSDWCAWKISTTSRERSEPTGGTDRTSLGSRQVPTELQGLARFDNHCAWVSVFRG